MTSEENCSHISSRGILKSCHIHSNNPISTIGRLIGYSALLSNPHPHGTTIYVTNSAIRSIILNIGTIPFKFVLVSGDSDDTVPDRILTKEEFNMFIDTPNLIHWYSQNCVSDHPKITRIPIGLDYHTIAAGKKPWGETITPMAQETDMRTIIHSSLPFWERETKCYTTFNLSLHEGTGLGYSRRDVIRRVPNNLVYYEPTFVTRDLSWRKQTQYAFVLSPHGIGLDCHRTWEALLLGCIPIVHKSNIDPLYKDLPVLIVEKWEDVTQELLDKTVLEFRHKTFSYEKLTLKYWMDMIHSYQ